MPVCGQAMHRRDLDEAGVIWALASFPVKTAKAKEMEAVTVGAFPKMEVEDLGTLFYNLLGPHKTEGDISYYYQIDAYKNKEGLNFHMKLDNFQNMMKARTELTKDLKGSGARMEIRVCEAVGKSNSKRFASYYPPGAKL